MKISDKGKEILCLVEGCKTKIYRDTKGLPTIGVGHLLTEEEIKDGRFLKGITKEEVYQLLDKDLECFENALNDCIVVPLTQNQYDALVIFSFNIGVFAFQKSTLLKRLNQKKYKEVPEQIRRWVKQPELKGRREREVALWEGKGVK
jgi:lysozyme